MTQLLLETCVLFFLIPSIVLAYYGDPNNPVEVPVRISAGSAAIGNKIYLFGGNLFFDIPRPGHEDDVLILTSTPNGTLMTDTVTPQGLRICSPCAGYALPDDNTIVAINAEYQLYNISSSNRTVLPAGLGFYDTKRNTWTYPSLSNITLRSLPTTRTSFTTAISPQSDAIYLIGGMEYYSENGEILPPQPAIDIYRFDIKNTSSVINLTSMNPNLIISNIGGSAQMLPNGVIVVAFGFDEMNGKLYPTNQVILFDTTTNRIYNQSVAGSSPETRVSASSTLGPDKSTIYYYGGGSDEKDIFTAYEGNTVPGMAILDTKSWSWISVPIIGREPPPCAHGTMTLLQASKLVIAGGKIGPFYTSEIGILTNLPTSNSSTWSSYLQWFTNNPEIDNAYLKALNPGLSSGVVAGIIITCTMVILILTLILSWIYIPATKKLVKYIQSNIISSPRSGEPLWAEATRSLVRFVLFLVFLAFIVNAIYKSIDSPISIQQKRIPTDRVLAPDIRFCFDGFDSTIPEDLFILCRFRNGTDCSQYIIPLDMSLHSPGLPVSLGSGYCFLFLPGLSFHIIDDKLGYMESTGTKIMFSFFAPPTLNTSDAVIHANIYAPEYDPNTVVYKLLNETSRLDPADLRKWTLEDKSSDVVGNSFVLRQGVYLTASFSLIRKETLRLNDRWNHVGFSSTYDEKLIITSQYRDAPPNANRVSWGYPIAELTIQPDSFTINIDREQKVFTLLNAVAQVGGLLGLFVAVQTLLFGFRPQSPWGIIHRWSFGRLRMKLANQLTSYFDQKRTPIPFASSISTVSRNNNSYVPLNMCVSSATDEAVDTSPVVENTRIPKADEESNISSTVKQTIKRMHQMEERMQLMEQLLKSYYLDDEVFQFLHETIERDKEEERLEGSSSSRSYELNSSALENEKCLLYDKVK